MKRLIVMFTMLVMAQGLSAGETTLLSPVKPTNKDYKALAALVTAKTLKVPCRVATCFGLAGFAAGITCENVPKDSLPIFAAIALGGYASEQLLESSCCKEISKEISENFRGDFEHEANLGATALTAAGTIAIVYALSK